MVMAKPFASTSTSTAWAACSTVSPTFQLPSPASHAGVIPVAALGLPVVVVVTEYSSVDEAHVDLLLSGSPPQPGRARCRPAAL